MTGDIEPGVNFVTRFMATQASWPVLPNLCVLPHCCSMHQRQPNTMSSLEARSLFTLQALNQDTSLSIRRAAKFYNVPQSMLASRRNGTSSQCNCTPKTMKLTTFGEHVIIDHTFNLDAQGFHPTRDILQGMANKLAIKSQHFNRQWKPKQHAKIARDASYRLKGH